MFGGYKPDSPNAEQLGGIAKRLAKIVRDNDSTRPVTAGLAGVVMSNATEYPAALDVTGYNYTEDRYQADHRKYPERIIYGSENRHDMAAWKAVRDNEFIFAQFLWTGIDYLGESGRRPSRGMGTGLLDFCGFPKGRGNFRAALWSETPVINIGVQRVQRNRNTAPSVDSLPSWNFPESQSVRVLCYTNAASAELFLDGEKYGEKKEFDDNTGVIFWDVPFKSGKLEAVGYDKDGNEICRNSVTTHDIATKISAEADKPTVKAGEKRVVHVVATILDNEDNLVFAARNRITCTLEGPGKLLGLESADNQDMSPYKGNERAAFRGVVMAYIQVDGTPGEVKVNFNAANLEPAETVIRIGE